jgi:2,3-diketo-5-methylthio-1-phosphopentane phosphatase
MKTAVVTDFDGTVTTFDIGDSICIHFGVVTPEEIDSSYAPGISVKIFMKKFFARLEVPEEEMRAFLVKNSVMRPGFATAARRLASAGFPLEVASGGVDFYIKTLFNHWDVRGVPVFCGKMRRAGGKYSITYPDIPGTLDDFKAARVRFYKKQGMRVIFCGDATSDLKASAQADIVFACGRLTKLCADAGIKTRKLEDFGAVADAALQG